VAKRAGAKGEEERRGESPRVKSARVKQEEYAVRRTEAEGWKRKSQGVSCPAWLGPKASETSFCLGTSGLSWAGTARRVWRAELGGRVRARRECGHGQGRNGPVATDTGGQLVVN
jgi:hypothetical protein